MMTLRQRIAGWIAPEMRAIYTQRDLRLMEALGGSETASASAPPRRTSKGDCHGLREPHQQQRASLPVCVSARRKGAPRIRSIRRSPGARSRSERQLAHVGGMDTRLCPAPR